MSSKICLQMYQNHRTVCYLYSQPHTSASGGKSTDRNSVRRWAVQFPHWWRSYMWNI